MESSHSNRSSTSSADENNVPESDFIQEVAAVGQKILHLKYEIETSLPKKLSDEENAHETFSVEGTDIQDVIKQLKDLLSKETVKLTHEIEDASKDSGQKDEREIQYQTTDMKLLEKYNQLDKLKNQLETLNKLDASQLSEGEQNSLRKNLESKLKYNIQEKIQVIKQEIDSCKKELATIQWPKHDIQANYKELKAYQEKHGTAGLMFETSRPRSVTSISPEEYNTTTAIAVNLCLLSKEYKVAAAEAKIAAAQNQFLGDKEMPKSGSTGNIAGKLISNSNNNDNSLRNSASDPVKKTSIKDFFTNLLPSSNPEKKQRKEEEKAAKAAERKAKHETQKAKEIAKKVKEIERKEKTMSSFDDPLNSLGNYQSLGNYSGKQEKHASTKSSYETPESSPPSSPKGPRRGGSNDG